MAGPTKPKLCLVLHSKAAMRDDVRAAVAAVREEGAQVDVNVTWEPGDAGRFARQAAEQEYDVVVAGGGDGTVNEVVSGMMEVAADVASLPMLAILPLGTANDFATSAAIPLDPLKALQLAAFGPTAIVDVGRAGQQYFLNVATGGFGAQVTTQTPDGLKQAMGGAAYVITGLAQLGFAEPAHARIQGPGFDWNGDFLAVAIGNGRQAGGGNVLCADALLDDGLLDVSIFPAGEIGNALAGMLQEGMEAVQRIAVCARVPSLQIESDKPLHMNFDGEPSVEQRFHFEVLRGRLAMKLPPNCPLLSKQAA